jgi:hypothetical protein
VVFGADDRWKAMTNLRNDQACLARVMLRKERQMTTRYQVRYGDHLINTGGDFDGLPTHSCGHKHKSIRKAVQCERRQCDGWSMPFNLCVVKLVDGRPSKWTEEESDEYEREQDQ